MANFNAEPQVVVPPRAWTYQSGVASSVWFGKSIVQHWYKLEAYDTGAGWVSWKSQQVNTADAPPPVGAYVNLAIEQSWFV